MIRVKICCIASSEEAHIAIAAGASALGLVSAMPSGPGPIPEERIAEIVRVAPPGVATFLLTSATDAETIISQQRRTGAGVLQLVDDQIPLPVYPVLRDALPGVKIVQVIHVQGEESVEQAQRTALYADALLLDSGNPNLAIRELGGTGRVHDWQISRRIQDSVGIPVYLAGGLRPENVREAIAAVNPFGLDVCTGVRTEGRLDPEKVRRFMTACQ